LMEYWSNGKGTGCGFSSPHYAITPSIQQSNNPTIQQSNNPTIPSPR
jgi:hypothetical protein